MGANDGAVMSSASSVSNAALSIRNKVVSPSALAVAARGADPSRPSSPKASPRASAVKTSVSPSSFTSSMWIAPERIT